MRKMDDNRDKTFVSHITKSFFLYKRFKNEHALGQTNKPAYKKLLSINDFQQRVY